MSTKPPAARTVIDHAGEATALLADIRYPHDQEPADLIAYAQVHATLAQAQAVNDLADLIREIHAELSEEAGD